MKEKDNKFQLKLQNLRPLRIILRICPIYLTKDTCIPNNIIDVFNNDKSTFKTLICVVFK